MVKGAFISSGSRNLSYIFFLDSDDITKWYYKVVWKKLDLVFQMSSEGMDKYQTHEMG